MALKEQRIIKGNNINYKPVELLQKFFSEYLPLQNILSSLYWSYCLQPRFWLKWNQSESDLIV